jgi:hypothetical protein
MIAMKMAYKNMVDAVEINLVAHDLHLNSFSTINQKMIVFNLYKL